MTTEPKDQAVSKPDARGSLPDAPLAMPKQVLTRDTPSLLARLFRPGSLKAGH